MTSPIAGIRAPPAEREHSVLAILPYGMLAFCVLCPSPVRRPGPHARSPGSS